MARENPSPIIVDRQRLAAAVAAAKAAAAATARRLAEQSAPQNPEGDDKESKP